MAALKEAARAGEAMEKEARALLAVLRARADAVAGPATHWDSARRRRSFRFPGRDFPNASHQASARANLGQISHFGCRSTRKRRGLEMLMYDVAGNCLSVIARHVT